MPLSVLPILAAAVAASAVLLTGAPKAAPDAAVLGPIALWPGAAPGDTGGLGVEHDTTKADEDPPGRRVIRLGNVSRPTVTVYRPDAAKNTGAAVVVCPGGGYSILAMDLEGTEVCRWLNSLGVTGVLLKYRVPARPGRERWAAPLQDAQRALGLVRQHAAEWGVDPKRVGVLGFSAGGNLSAELSTHYADRTYPAVDDADRESCRPDFTVLIYPAYLTAPDGSLTLSSEIKVDHATPPAFITMTEDDPVHVENAIAYALALKNAKVPVELHVYPSGGHGYGLRPSEHEVSQWPERAAAWLAAQGWLKPRQ